MPSLSLKMPIKASMSVASTSLSEKTLLETVGEGQGYRGEQSRGGEAKPEVKAGLGIEAGEADLARTHRHVT